ncbi:MAG: hypothetical protein JWP94_3471 [Mucilaginibacter sp.]|jgi:hypothetical protein|nr:hypothetical protein [Mucilaginibacter sp.]
MHQKYPTYISNGGVGGKFSGIFYGLITGITRNYFSYRHFPLPECI